MPIVKNDFEPNKRAFLLFGSPHQTGNTAKLVDMFRDVCPSQYIWNTWYCFDHDVKPCTDCRYCHHRDGCAQSDLDDFYILLEEADLLVIATPVYNLSYSAPLKILMDRTQRYWAARFIRGKKPPIKRAKQVVLLTTAETDKAGGEMIERQLKPTLTILNAKWMASVHVLATESADTWQSRVCDAAAAISLQKN